MSSCPSMHQLQSMLAGALDDQQADTLRNHVNACDTCEASLKAICAELECEPWGPAAGKTATAYHDEPALKLLVERVSAYSFAGVTAESPNAASGGVLGVPRCPGDVGSIGDYRLISEIGRGGMGLVYHGFDQTLRRPVAIKILRPELADERSRLRFVQEARAAARIKHDNIVDVHAVIVELGSPPFIVMELASGPTLAALLQERKTLEPATAAEIIAQAADGLAAAHAAGLMHRDVKPSNILIEGQTGRTKLLDFGLARLHEQASGLTQERSLAGTPIYMSPEQIRAPLSVDCRTDIYSLGATFYEALTGAPPFRGTTQRVLQQVLGEEPPPPRRLNEATPADLDIICQKAMAKDPAHRYQTAAALADDLRRWLRGVPIQARPVGSLESAWRWCRRNRRVSALALALIVTLLTGLAVTFGQWRRAERNLHELAVQHAVSRQALQETLDAVDQFYTRVSEDRLLRQPGLEPLRKDLLTTARRYYEKFVELHSDDVQVRHELARALARLVKITWSLDGAPAAAPLIERALVLQRGLLDQRPDDLELEHDLADSLNIAATVYLDQGETQRAKPLYSEAIQKGQRLVALRPDDPRPRGLVARASNNLGILCLRSNDRLGAEAAYSEAVKQHAALAKDYPQNRAHVANLAQSCMNLAEVHLLDTHRSEVATSLYERALAAWRSLGPSEVHKADQDLGIGICLVSLAYLRLDSGPAAEVERKLNEGMTRLHAAVDASPKVPELRWQLGRNCTLASRIYVALGNPERAAELCQEGKRLLEALCPNDVFFTPVAGCDLAVNYQYMGALLADSGQIEKALSWFDRSIPLHKRVLAQQPDFGLCRIALSRAYLLRALTYLEKGDPVQARKEFLGGCEFLDSGFRECLAPAGLYFAACAGDDDARKKLRSQSLQSLETLDHALLAPVGMEMMLLARIAALAGSAHHADRRSPSGAVLSQAEPDAAFAMRALQRARQARYFYSTKHVETLMADHAFDELRHLAAFQAFLASVRSTASR